MNSWRRWFSRGRWEHEIDDEMRDHLERQTAANIAAGMTPVEARRQARLQFGAVEGVKQECREERPGSVFGALAADVRYALRLLRKNPAFTVLAVVTLAFGIGASTAIFTLVDAVLLRPLPYADPSRLVWITEETPTNESTGVSWLNFQDWKRLNDTFSAMAGYRDTRMTVAGDEFPELIGGRFVTAGYFDLIGIAPLVGRWFHPDENAVGGPNVAMLSYEFWQERFGGAGDVLAKQLRINGKSFTIVGVMPRGFGAVTRTSVWAPFESNVPRPYLSGRDIAWLLFVVGRTKTGVSFQSARADMDRVGNLLAMDYPNVDANSRPVVKDLTRYMLGENRTVLLLLAAAGTLLFLITCANLAGLLLVKTRAREREFCVRLALGASRRHVTQQLIVEGLVLALAGGLLGLAIAGAGVRLAAAVVPGGVPLAAALHLNLRAFFFLLLISVAASLAMGFLPARFAASANLQDALRASSRNVRGGHGREHAVLLVCEVGLAMAVLVATGLLVRTMLSLVHTRIGFDSTQLLSATVTLPSAEYPNPPDAARFMDRGLERIRQLPGVESAAAVFPVPFTPQIYQVWLAIQGRAPKPGEEQVTYVSVVSPNYLDLMKIPVLAGRGFVPADAGRDSGVIVLDGTLARRYCGNESPIGRSVKLFTENFADPKQKPFEVVGVAEPVRAGGLDEEPQPRVYVLMNQLSNNSMTFIARTTADPALLARPIADAIHGVNRNVPVFGVGSMADSIRKSQQSRRLAMLLLISFSAAALLLAAIGLYGVVSQLVAQRTNEIGIRMALGAHPRDVAALVLRYAIFLVAGGLAIGIPAALGLGQLMRALLYGVTPFDSATFGVAALVILCVTLAACCIPALRATRVDPMVALRYE